MAESTQERNVMIKALTEEISDASKHIKYLDSEISKIEGIQGMEGQIAMLTRDRLQFELARDAAAEQIAIRTGQQEPKRRGPGRPPKSTA